MKSYSIKLKPTVHALFCYQGNRSKCYKVLMLPWLRRIKKAKKKLKRRSGVARNI
jgi:hypothetical protein